VDKGKYKGTHMGTFWEQKRTAPHIQPFGKRIGLGLFAPFTRAKFSGTAENSRILPLYIKHKGNTAVCNQGCWAHKKKHFLGSTKRGGERSIFDILWGPLSTHLRGKHVRD